MRAGRWVCAVTVLTGAVAATPASSQDHDDCRFRRDVVLNQPLAAADLLRLSAGAGSLEVRGVVGLNEARLRGVACASSRELLDGIGLEAQRVEDGVYVKAVFPQDRNFGEHHATLDLVVEVPAGARADISDGSGSAEISGVGDLVVADGSGELRITDILGSVKVNDGSGSLLVSGVALGVEIIDGSGEVRVRDIGGTVRLRDGSGSIDVREVRGDLVVATDGSGSIDWSAVNGRVSIPERKRGGGAP